jgi:serine/threonine protein kinase
MWTMIDRLRFIADKYGIGEDALRELTELYDGSLPRTPTHRLGNGATHHAVPAPLAPEDLKRRYEDIRRIGLGGFSEVREVWDRHVSRPVALKVQLPSRSSPDDCARFRQEV